MSFLISVLTKSLKLLYFSLLNAFLSLLKLMLQVALSSDFCSLVMTLGTHLPCSAALWCPSQVEETALEFSSNDLCV